MIFFLTIFFQILHYQKTKEKKITFGYLYYGKRLQYDVERLLGNYQR